MYKEQNLCIIIILRSINWKDGFNSTVKGGDIKQHPPGQMEMFFWKKLLNHSKIFLSQNYFVIIQKYFSMFIPSEDS